MKGDHTVGLFDGNLKRQLEEAVQKNAQLEKSIQEFQENQVSLKNQISTLEQDKKTLELDKKSLKMEIDTYTNLLADDAGNIKSSKIILGELQHKISKYTEELSVASQHLAQLNETTAALQKEYIVLDEGVLLQSFGLYIPKYKFANSSQYKDRLTEIRDSQAQMIKEGTAAICLKIWSVEGSAVKGKKLTEDNIKQIIRTFNIECDNIVQSVKFSNYEASKKRISKSFDGLNKLNSINKIVIQENYLELKFQELDLAFEYAQKLQEEKEELRQQRELRREELRLAKELEEKRAEIEKEQQHYENAMLRLVEQIEVETNSERLEVLQQRKQELSDNLIELDAALKDIDYREANQRAGYVYVISNLGAFGENIYKIGMTRRLEPQDRVDELGGASVPFRFDVHALIFSNDAPKLESALHRAFDDKRVNMVNGRKEFFNVTLEEIEAVVKANHDKTVDFNYLSDAMQYRESLLLQKSEVQVILGEHYEH